MHAAARMDLDGIVLGEGGWAHKALRVPVSV